MLLNVQTLDFLHIGLLSFYSQTKPIRFFKEVMTN